jgi:N-acetylneuraminic acid mutarotase
MHFDYAQCDLKAKGIISMKLKLFFCLLLFAVISIHAQDGWERMQDMDHEGVYQSTCLLDGRIYVFNPMKWGYYILSSVEAYDIAADDWIPLSNMPKPVGNPHVCAVNNRIYVIGGWFDLTQVSIVVALNYQYNPQSDSWLPKANCPLPTTESPSCVLNDRIYIFGVREIETSEWWLQKNVFRYDPAEDSWDTLPETNFLHSDGDAVALNNKIYLISSAWEGQDSDENYYCYPEGRSEMYDPETNRFTEISRMPYPVGGHASTVHNGKILVFGGDTAAPYFWADLHGTDLVQEYDPATNTWRVMQGMPFPRFGCRAETMGDYVYIIGGMDNDGRILKEVWRFDLNYLELLSTNDPMHPDHSPDALVCIRPNPASSCIHIDLPPGWHLKSRAELLDIQGKILIRETLLPNQASFSFDLSSCEEGIYLVRIHNAQYSVTEKVVKVK